MRIAVWLKRVLFLELSALHKVSIRRADRCLVEAEKRDVLARLQREVSIRRADRCLVEVSCHGSAFLSKRRFQSAVRIAVWLKSEWISEQISAGVFQSAVRIAVWLKADLIEAEETTQ